MKKQKPSLLHKQNAIFKNIAIQKQKLKQVDSPTELIDIEKPIQVVNNKIHQMDQLIILELKSLHEVFLKGQFDLYCINCDIEVDLCDIGRDQLTSFHQDSEYPHKLIFNQVYELEERAVDYVYEQIPNSTQINEFMLLRETKNIAYIVILDHSNFEVIDTQPLHLHMDPLKRSTLRAIEQRVILVCGEKNTGKSTTCLMLCNLFKGAMLLDCDIGQPYSWGIPGFITLYEVTQPIFTAQPKRVYQGFVGEFSTMNYFELYFSQIRGALAMVGNRRLIINTQGFIQNLGAVVLQYLIQIIRPDEVLLLSQSKQQQQQQQRLKAQLESQIISFPLTSRPIDHFNVSTVNHIVDNFRDVFNTHQQKILVHVGNPQSRKKRRESLLLKQFNIAQQPIYIQLNNAPAQRIPICSLVFLTLPHSIDVSPLQEIQRVSNIHHIAQQFIMNLVSIIQVSSVNHDYLDEISQNSLGIGLIKDVDIDNQTIDVICSSELNGSYLLVKSQYFELGRETLEVKVDDIQQQQDYQNLVSGRNIKSNYSIPYIYPSSQAVGMNSLKIGINKKIQKKL